MSSLQRERLAAEAVASYVTAAAAAAARFTVISNG